MHDCVRLTSNLFELLMNPTIRCIFFLSRWPCMFSGFYSGSVRWFRRRRRQNCFVSLPVLCYIASDLMFGRDILMSILLYDNIIALLATANFHVRGTCG
ncbi:hypothetical protein GE21DRAFT_1348053 [Neurospora crassa]|nr:hypothetical protein GE21DRAFT_1348053 [Neurospora crassa]